VPTRNVLLLTLKVMSMNQKALKLFAGVCLFSAAHLCGAADSNRPTVERSGVDRPTANCPPLLNFKMPRLQDDKPQDLCQYAGRVVLVVNTASYCGYTNQYRDLEAIHEKYQKRGFTVLGFPSNDFGSQEPKDNKAIADFCTNTFGVKFPMFAKSQVIQSAAAKASPFYEGISKTAKIQPQWNFHKYLLGKNGQLIASFASDVAPLDSRLTKAIEAAL
jgi:glutathione peroxidase